VEAHVQAAVVEIVQVVVVSYMGEKIIIATRGSKLALWQANFVASLIRERYRGIQIELKRIKTSGDKILDVPLARIGGKGLFVKEIEECLLRGEADIAVHSMKDVPAQLPEGLEIAVIPPREEPWDCLLSLSYPSLKDLPPQAQVGTSSLRRQAQLRALRPDIEIKMLRGNLDTRVRKLKQGEFDAIVVAMAGLRRLGIVAPYMQKLCLPKFYPAVAQGALGIEVSSENRRVKRLISPLQDPVSRICVEAERGFLFEMEGGCQVPLGAHAHIEGEEVVISGFVGDVNGENIISSTHRGAASDPVAVGRSLAHYLLSRGGREILDKVYGGGEK